MPLKKTDREVLGDTGEGYVGLMATKMGYSWHHLGGKVAGIDGQFEIVKKHRATGLFVAVQVKSGSRYLVRETNSDYIIRVNPKHVEYWKSLSMPVILIWYNPKQKKAYWSHISYRTATQWKYQISISKNSKFGTHSKGNMFVLAAEFYKIRPHLPIFKAASIFNVNLRETKRVAREFYLRWRALGCQSPALGRVLITNRGWRHLTAEWRSCRDICHKLELLGAARDILENVRHFSVCRKLNCLVRGEVKPRVLYEQKAIIRYPYQDRRDAIISVITEKIGDGPPHFYSVYEHHIREREREEVAIHEV